MYLAWRVACGLHTKITYSFMVAGHTKFSPDGFFGLLKLKLRKSEVNNLDDLVNIVNNSILGSYNQAQTIFDKGGNCIIHFYNWTEFLSNYFKTIPNILKYHHFIFYSNNVGKVKVKKTIDRDEQIVDIIKKKKLEDFHKKFFLQDYQLKGNGIYMSRYVNTSEILKSKMIIVHYQPFKNQVDK